MGENDIGKYLVDTAVQLHKDLGPGLFEVVYETVLAHELCRKGMHVERQVSINLEYHGLKFEEAFRADLIIEDKVIVELKYVERLNSSHKKQLLTYLRLTGIRLGFLLNFSEARMKDGIVRTVNQLVEK